MRLPAIRSRTKSYLALVITCLALTTGVACETRHEFRSISESPYVNVIPECDHLTSKSGDPLSRFIVLNPDSSMYEQMYGEGALTYTEANCQRYVVRITEFASDTLATQHLANQRISPIPFPQFPRKAVRVNTAMLRDESNFFFGIRVDYASVFREPYWPASRTYAAFSNEWDYSEDSVEPYISDGVDLWIIVPVGNLVVTYGQFSQDKITENSGEGFFATLEAVRDVSNQVVTRLEVRKEGLSLNPIISSMPPSTPTPTPEEEMKIDELVEALFWVHVESAGLSKSLSFSEAKHGLFDVLFAEADRRLTKIEDNGIDPFEVFPYCIGAHASMNHLALLMLAENPQEAARESNGAIDMIESLDSLVLASSQEERPISAMLNSRQRCEEFAKELDENNKGLTGVK